MSIDKKIETPAKQSGFLLADKPAGWTSFDVVAKLRGITGVKRIGHAGTLDPFATGLLIVAIGREATRKIDGFMKLDKTYETTIYLGATSTTDDITGDIKQCDAISVGEKKWSREEIEKTMQKFIGTFEQIPPMFSAIKQNGRRLYKMARAGKVVERKPRAITIHKIYLLKYEWPALILRIKCGSGTYIRALARDLGETLGVGGYCETLRRLQIGGYDVKDAWPIEKFTHENWQTRLLKENNTE